MLSFTIAAYTCYVKGAVWIMRGSVWWWGRWHNAAQVSIEYVRGNGMTVYCNSATIVALL